MSMNADKFRRLRSAALNDENPMVKAFNDHGVSAKKNTNIATQRSHGDVLLTIDSTPRSVESQVATYANFSYALHKVKEYVGPGLPEHAYVMLGCKREQNSKEMFYLFCQAVALHRYIKDNSTSLLSPDQKYYIIPPGNLADLPGDIGIGDNIQTAVKDFLDSLVMTR